MTVSPSEHPENGPGMTPAAVAQLVADALAEDAPWGDISGEASIPAQAGARAELVSREPGVLAGVACIVEAFRQTDPRSEITVHLSDGARLAAGSHIATIAGNARAILRAERIALNFAQRLSGIATLTARYVEAVAGTGARIADTRKTTPTLRMLERAAVRAGGAHNHRFSLSDAVMLKDNHLAVLTAQGLDLTEAIHSVRARIPHTMHLEVEVDRLDQLPAVLAATPDTVMLDNFDLDSLRAGVALVDGRCVVEASGGVTLDTVRAIAETGVDVISVGALTHSARALDLALDIEAH